MSTRPRNPVNWPKMKIRGAKRKYLANLRQQSIVWARAFIDGRVTVDGGYETKFRLDPRGDFILKMTTTRDGFGRAVR